ncbi:putative mediator of RNA polymerase II transcription subunit 29 isoform X2 [Scaptodrosophila lebanonensis]|uniref:Mediator of RNA polymerase II transcription subunit 29 isoform X2 n=1 Tax=Drosophila lebanonensis TaxID=7225 RepID=A0A6J2UH88_DROLE|nr:putative mediator of RNA polymerase II transcription subunit 29 isoform X2 [Scaptodrosophila lebanonensis]
MQQIVTDNTGTELARENIFQHNLDDAKPANKATYGDGSGNANPNSATSANAATRTICSIENQPQLVIGMTRHANNNNNSSNNINNINNHSPAATANNNNASTANGPNNAVVAPVAPRKRHLSSSNLVNDLEILDRELSAINAPMPLIDPEITQGAEQLEAALSSRKRLRSNSEDESDRLVREALSQYYIPPQRFISAIEDCPLDVVGLGVGMGMGVGVGVGLGVGVCAGAGAGSVISSSNNNNSGGGCNDHGPNGKRAKLGGSSDHLELVDFDMNQNQKDFEVIMDALRLGTPSPTSASDSCGQAAMMSESASVFHNLVVTSLET